MRTLVAALLLGAIALTASGCLHHPGRHHGPKPKVVVKPGHGHHDPAIVVVHKKPGKHRHCSTHDGHWHCPR